MIRKLWHIHSKKQYMLIKTEVLKFAMTSKIAYVLLSKSRNKYCTLNNCTKFLKIKEKN